MARWNCEGELLVRAAAAVCGAGTVRADGRRSCLVLVGRACDYCLARIGAELRRECVAELARGAALVVGGGSHAPHALTRGAPAPCCARFVASRCLEEARSALRTLTVARCSRHHALRAAGRAWPRYRKTRRTAIGGRERDPQLALRARAVRSGGTSCSFALSCRAGGPHTARFVAGCCLELSGGTRGARAIAVRGRRVVRVQPRSAAAARRLTQLRAVNGRESDAANASGALAVGCNRPRSGRSFPSRARAPLRARGKTGATCETARSARSAHKVR
jgi:hypothetical protein